MASKKYDSFKELRKGKYDWKVQSRLLNMWRGYTKTKEPFKSFNLLLLDSKRARIHAFVPGNIADDVEKLLVVGNVYLIENFTVKDYKMEDNFRCLRKPIQIIFTAETEITPLEETDVSIENLVFDFFDLAELEPLASQNKYLTNVIGFMEPHEPLAKIKNRHGQIQSQMRFKITDGSTTVRVTFWDEFAELFSETLEENNFTYPLIIIIGCGRVTKWSGEVDISNVGATTFHINAHHHTVTQMRRMLLDPSFSKANLAAPQKVTPKLYTVEEIKNFGEEHIKTEVLCSVKLLMLQQMQTWFVQVCTSCYKHVEMVGHIYRCIHCQRKGSYPDKKFEISVVATDETGTIDIILEDREVRTLIGKSVFELIDEGHTAEKIPDILKTVENMDCIVKLLIRKENILKEAATYIARDIIQGCNIQAYTDTEQSFNHPHPISHMDTQPSGSSYHLDSSEISNKIGQH